MFAPIIRGFEDEVGRIYDTLDPGIEALQELWQAVWDRRRLRDIRQFVERILTELRMTYRQLADYLGLSGPGAIAELKQGRVSLERYLLLLDLVSEHVPPLPHLWTRVGAATCVVMRMVRSCLQDHINVRMRPRYYPWLRRLSRSGTWSRAFQSGDTAALHQTYLFEGSRLDPSMPHLLPSVPFPLILAMFEEWAPAYMFCELHVKAGC